MSRFQRLFRRQQSDSELDEELQTHLRLAAQDRIERGEPPEQARAGALREFGNVGLVKEVTRDMWGWGWLETLLQDLRYAVRSMRHSPGFTAVAVITLALGIGANTAIFTVADAVFFKHLPYPDVGRVVWVTEFMPQSSEFMAQTTREVVFTPEYAAWDKVPGIFDQLGAFQITGGINLTGGVTPERIMAGHVSSGFFSVLGVQPALGRTFSPEEGLPGHDRVAVLSNALWRSYFNAEADVVGCSIVLDGVSYGVIGVMPPQFFQPGSAAERVWLPFALPPGAERPANWMRIVSVIGRLKHGVKPEQAQAALELTTRRLDNQYPHPWDRFHASAHPKVIPLRDWLTREVRPALYVMLGAVGLVLLIACANVANLLLARAVSREKEIAVRAAIGAGRARLIRQMLTESAILALAGGGLGLLLAPLLTAILEFYVPQSLSAHAHVDLRVLGMTTACCVLAAVIFGLAPALAVSKPRLTESLKESTSRLGESKAHARMRSGLVVVQLALSVVLLVGAGLLVKSFWLLLQVNAGIDPHNVLLAWVPLPPGNAYDPPRQRDFYRQVLERLKTLPGVEFAAATTETPFTVFNAIANGLKPEGGQESNLLYCPATVTPHYFQAMGIRLLSGRFFDEHDAAGAPPVVILDQSLAHAMFPGQDAAGRRVLHDNVWRTVVGVVEDTRHLGLSEKVTPELYTSYLQEPSGYMDIVLRTTSNPLSYVPAVRNAVLAADKNQPLGDVKTMDQLVSESLSDRRERLLLLGAFAVLAVLIAASGVYAVNAYSVSRRTHEIGVRLAMGARRDAIMRMMIAQGLRVILLGITAGLSAALGLSRVLASFLYHTAPRDGLTFAAVAVLMGAIACLAVYVPARRATKVDPMVALRYE